MGDGRIWIGGNGSQLMWEHFWIHPQAILRFLFSTFFPTPPYTPIPTLPYTPDQGSGVQGRRGASPHFLRLRGRGVLQDCVHQPGRKNHCQNGLRGYPELLPRQLRPISTYPNPPISHIGKNRNLGNSLLFHMFFFVLTYFGTHFTNSLIT